MFLDGGIESLCGTMIVGTQKTQHADTLHTMMFDIATLTPSESNYNKHPKEQIQQLCDDLEEFGQMKNIVVQDRNGVPTIIAGEGLWLAFQQLAKKDMARWSTIWAVIAPPEWDEAKADAFLVADNETRNGSITDKEALFAILEKRHDSGFGLSAVGYTSQQYEDLVNSLKPPTLDDLANKYGDDPDAETFWPVIRVKVSPETKEKYDELLKQAPFGDETRKFSWLIDQLSLEEV